MRSTASPSRILLRAAVFGGALVLAGCSSESDRDRKLEERIAAAEAKAAAAEKRAAAAESAAGSVSPVTVGSADDAADINPDGDGADTQPDDNADVQSFADPAPDGEAPEQQVVVQPPDGGFAGPVEMGSPPIAS